MANADSCGGINTEPGISFFTVAVSLILAIGTTILHVIILRSIIKIRKGKLQIFFYKCLLNISIADLLSGVLTDPYSVIFHIQEGLLQKPIEIKVIHVMLYLFGSVPLQTMVLLCIDRVFALLRPLTYRKGPQGRRAWVLIIFTWVISALLISAYFKIDFISYLIIFASVNISGAIISMVVTSYIYHKKLGKRAINKGPGKSNKPSTDACSTPSQSPDNCTTTAHVNVVCREENKSIKRKNDGGATERQREKSTKRERNATKTFLIMTCVVVMSYLPTCFATAYMNACTNCNCKIVHSMRDIAITSILAGPFFRAINFLLCLKPLRTSLRKGSQGEDSSQISLERKKSAMQKP